MSKLKTIRQELERNTCAIVTNTGEGIHLPDRESYPHYEGGLAHAVYFYVAPNEVLYSADKLNLFMDNLVPNLQPTNKTPFSHESYAKKSPYYLHYGSMTFDEAIGKETTGIRTLTISDEDFKNEWGFHDGEMTLPIHEEDLLRRIFIKVYPHKDIARVVAGIYEGVARNKGENYEELHSINHFFEGCTTKRFGGVTEIDPKGGLVIEYLKEYIKKL